MSLDVWAISWPVDVYEIKNEALLESLFANHHGCLKDDIVPEPIICDKLRQKLRRNSYTWHKHPNCRRYNGSIGCFLTQPINVEGYNYDSLYDYFLELQQTQVPDRKILYRILNRAIGTSGIGIYINIQIYIYIYLYIYTNVT